MDSLLGRRRGVAAAIVGTALLGGLAIGLGGTRPGSAADHEDSPLVQGDQAADIADVYSFRSPTNPNKLVLVMTLSDVLPAPEIRLGRSIFSQDVLYQFKIDNDGDAVEDLVIQAFALGNRRNQVMSFRGPLPPVVIGTQARICFGPATNVRVSTGSRAIVKSKRGMKVFAGVRDDPFFFDFGAFLAVVADITSGNGANASFDNPGTDSFAGLNVYSIVVEVPIERLGGDPDDIAVWGTTNRM